MLGTFITNKIKFKFLQRKWRKINKHNRTGILNTFQISKVTVGNHTYGNLAEKLTIGHFCSIASGVKFILGGNHPYEGFSTYPFRAYFFNDWGEAESKGEIIVSDDVWIGCNTLILSGVTIGQGAIIAAGSIVTKDIPPYSIVAGSPAKVIKPRFTNPEIISELLKIDFSRIQDHEIVKYKDILYNKILNIDDIPHFLK